MDVKQVKKYYNPDIYR